MGCFGRLFNKWRRRLQGTTDPNQPPYGVRLSHTAHDSITWGASDLTDLEKAYIRDRDGKEIGIGHHGRRSPISQLPPSASNYRPNVNPQFSAYSGVAIRTDRASNYSRDNWTGSQSSTQVPSRQSDQHLSKIKDEGGVEDPEQEARRKKAEEIRRKFEEEEQERLDFFQMM